MTPEQLLALMSESRATFSAGVATIWRNLSPLLGDYDLSRLRMLISGGGAPPESLSRTYLDTIGVCLTNAWGMTETSPVVLSSRISTVHEPRPMDEQLAILCTPGPPVPLTQVRVALEQPGEFAPWDGRTPGELQVAGPTIASNYYGLSGSGSGFTEDGWLQTGDMATIDQYGYVRIVDRVKDLVKSGGEWISSVDLENAIMSHPLVNEATVVAVPDERWGERPLACVVTKSGESITSDEVRAHLGGLVADWWIPERVVVLDEIPKTATGEASKLLLRNKFN